MKSIIVSVAVLISSLSVFADALHPNLISHMNSIKNVYEYALHTVGYPGTEFSNLIGTSSTQDLVRKIRVVKYNFTQENCAKNLEIYTKIDGSAVLSHKVVGCAP